MRPTIERLRDLNDLIDSVPEEIYRQIQEESAQQENDNENEEMSNKISKSQRIRDYIESHRKLPTNKSSKIYRNTASNNRMLATYEPR